MVSTELTITVTHLRREQMLIELPHGTMVGDHPTWLGGEGRGPSAGELIMFAFTSATVLAASEASARLGLAVSPIVSRATFQTVREPVWGKALETIARMASLPHRLELGYDGDYMKIQEVVAAALDSPVARALRHGIALNERVVLNRTGGPRRLNDHVNQGEYDKASNADLKEGDEVVSPPEGRWRVSATAIGTDSALIQHDHQRYVAGRPGGPVGSGPTPNELLVASLAACTTFFLIHHGRFREIPIESIVVTAIAQVDDAGVITSIDKTTTVSGAISDDEIAEVEFITNNCWAGVTMRHGVEPRPEVAIVTPSAGSVAAVSLTPSVSGADADCEDGSCCVPDYATPASSTTSSA
jgi:uncharacterized OsmC-like protein